jgi:hypothetical protein
LPSNFGLATLLALGACNAATTSGAGAPDDSGNAPNGAALAHIGPDVTLEALCGSSASGAVASVSNLAPDGPAIVWTANLVGDDALKISTPNETFAQDVGVATVVFTPPLQAMPGDDFHGTVTVRASDGSFPSGSVKVTAHVIATKLSTDATGLDFGVIPPNTFASLDVTFRNDSRQDVIIMAPKQEAPFTFTFTQPSERLGPGQTITLTVGASSATPGDYTFMATWATFVRADVGLPAACAGFKTLPLHVRVAAN